MKAIKKKQMLEPTPENYSKFIEDIFSGVIESGPSEVTITDNQITGQKITKKITIGDLVKVSIEKDLSSINPRFVSIIEFSDQTIIRTLGDVRKKFLYEFYISGSNKN